MWLFYKKMGNLWEKKTEKIQHFLQLSVLTFTLSIGFKYWVASLSHDATFQYFSQSTCLCFTRLVRMCKRYLMQSLKAEGTIPVFGFSQYRNLKTYIMVKMNQVCPTHPARYICTGLFLRLDFPVRVFLNLWNITHFWIDFFGVFPKGLVILDEF